MAKQELNSVEYPCPMCKKTLSEAYGHAIHPHDKAFGVSLWCESKEFCCKEVMGHGSDSKSAYQVIQEKYKFWIK